MNAEIMAVQAMTDRHEMGHMPVDVPALLLVAGVLGYLSSGKSQAAAMTGTSRTHTI